uniref:Uncharacterized protein n=1 Tax=Sphaerodactylus townsendi TaxID=933632 RepID=A0ACB8EE70_9SAUR
MDPYPWTLQACLLEDPKKALMDQKKRLEEEISFLTKKMALMKQIEEQSQEVARIRAHRDALREKEDHLEEQLRQLHAVKPGTSGGTAGAVAAEMPQARPAGYLEVISQANMKLMNLERRVGALEESNKTQLAELLSLRQTLGEMEATQERMKVLCKQLLGTS